MDQSEFDAGIVEAAILGRHELENAVFRTTKQLLEAMLVDRRVADDLDGKFRPALDDIVKVEIRDLPEESGAFTVSDGVMSLNEADVARLFSYAITDMKSQLINSGNQIDAEEIRQTLEDALCLFSLHELRHRTQGVGNYSVVQLLKKIDGREHISKFDIQADRDAALALAATKAHSSDCDDFLEAYQNALYYSVKYFFKIYPANRGRLDKTCRVAALLLMLARLQIYRAGVQNKEIDPTSALHVKISADRTSIAVFENEPFERLLIASNDLVGLPDFVELIETGEIDKAYGESVRLAVRLGLV